MNTQSTSWHQTASTTSIQFTNQQIIIDTTSLEVIHHQQVITNITNSTCTSQQENQNPHETPQQTGEMISEPANENVQQHGLLQFAADKVTDPLAQFEVEPSMTSNDLVHIKSRFTNRYLVRYIFSSYLI